MNRSSEAIGHRAGQLIGSAGNVIGQALDAMVAATAIARLRRRKRPTGRRLSC